MSEQDQIDLLKKGDQNAFKLLVERQQDRVFNTVLGIIQDQQEAEDVAQEVFIQVYRSIQGFKGDSMLSTWIYRIAITKSLDWLRKKKARQILHKLSASFIKGEKGVDPIEFVHPGVQLEQKELAAKLFKAMQFLPNNQRVAFSLIKIEGLSYDEVSKIMNSSVKAVESIMHRAKENLRKILKNNI